MLRVPLPPEPFPNVTFERGYRDVPIENVSKNAFLVGRYAYFTFQKQIPLAGNKGRIYFGRMYDIFSQKFRDHPVVIKKLNKPPVIRDENPFHEVAASRLIGDNEHCVQVIEALQDERHYYIVTKFVGNDLCNTIHATDPDSSINVHRISKQIARSLQYVKRHNLIHRDVSPENVIISKELGCPFIDFAMSLRIATLEGNPQLISPRQGWCGKPPYVSPEVLLNRELDFGVDLWGFGQILIILWTGSRLYEVTGDRSWKFWIRDRGISFDNDTLDAEFERFHSFGPNLPEDYIALQSQIPRIQHGLTFQQRQLLAGIFVIDATQRFTIEQVIQSLHQLEL